MGKDHSLCCRNEAVRVAARLCPSVTAKEDTVITFDGLSKQYGAFTAVRSLAFSVHQGEVFGFLGPNGAGKTTTIRMLMGILVPSAGHVSIAGLDCQRDRIEVKRRVGYLPDAPIFYDFLRGREILQFVGEMHGQSRGVAADNAARLLDELALTEAAEEYAINYSTGMKKKLGLACALIHDPAVLILDEPTNGLDPRASREVQDRLRRSSAEGKTIFLSTHLLDMAERLCSRVGIIHQGELVAEGALQELRARIVPGGSLEEVFLKVTQPEDGAAAVEAASGGTA
jgi:ABC-2 type transport system ATP-binding protein